MHTTIHQELFELAMDRGYDTVADMMIDSGHPFDVGWMCWACRRVAYVSYVDLAEIGPPHCCDAKMEMGWKDPV